MFVCVVCVGCVVWVWVSAAWVYAVHVCVSPALYRYLFTHVAIHTRMCRSIWMSFQDQIPKALILFLSLCLGSTWLRTLLESQKDIDKSFTAIANSSRPARYS
jgi:hypothetical protein